jgi:hypothetical protein
MISTLIAGIVVFFTIPAIEKRKDGTLGDTSAMAFVVIPAILSTLLLFGGAALGVSAVSAQLLLLLYFIVPFLMTRH